MSTKDFYGVKLESAEADALDSLNNLLKEPLTVSTSSNCYFLTNDEHVSVLSLNNCQLKALPSVLGCLKMLTSLDLESNNLEKIPETVCDLEQIINLNLSYNKIKTLPNNFGNLKRLNLLNLSRNQLEILPEGLSSLKFLERLYLQCNKLKSLPEDFYTLPSLRFLSLQSNNLTYLGKALRGLKMLEIFEIFDNPLQEFPDLRECVNLSTIVIAGINETKMVKFQKLPEWIANLPNITKLYVSKKLADQNLDLLSSLSLIQKVEITVISATGTLTFSNYLKQIVM